MAEPRRMAVCSVRESILRGSLRSHLRMRAADLHGTVFEMSEELKELSVSTSLQ